MSLFIDGIIFSLQRHGGITVYFRELINHLINSHIDLRINLEKPLIQGMIDLDVVSKINWNKSRYMERFRDCRISDDDISLFHSTYYRLPERRSIPSIVTVHDFTYERFRRGPARWAHSLQKKSAIEHADAIICISESTRDDLYEFVGVRPDQTLHVIHNGVSPVFKKLVLIPPIRPFLLFVGERRGYKNFKLALHALKHLPDFELHCVGGGPLLTQEFTNFPLNVTKRVRHLGLLSEDQLNFAYNHALCLLYPTRYEGFGIPVIEAMQAGCPVVTINCKAVREIGGDALECVEIEDPLALSEAVIRLCAPDYRNLKIEAGLKRSLLYDWSICHQKTLQVYRTLIHL